MRVIHLFRNLYQKNALLATAGWLHIMLFLLFVLLIPFDDRLITNVNPWIKPAKFAISIAIFAWSMGWIMYELKENTRRIKTYSKIFVGFMVTEMFIIALQAARGTTSHFNVFRSAFDAGLFSMMGVVITLNLILTIVVFIEFFRQKLSLPTYKVWAIRLGLFSLILASLEGFVMVAYMAHTVGTADGGPGLPVLNWSTIAGDLRIAHFMGMHGLQIFPLFAFLLSRWKAQHILRLQSSVLFSFAFLYLLLMNFTFWQAINKIPLIRL